MSTLFQISEMSDGGNKIMKKALLYLAIILLLVMTTGCASTKQFVPLPDQSKQIENPDMARIYVVRPTILGGGVPMTISDSIKLIGQTGPNGYLSWECEPGQVKLVGIAENMSTLPISLEKGIVYYIQQHVCIGFMFARNKLRLLDEKEGKKKLEDCKPPIVELGK